MTAIPRSAATSDTLPPVLASRSDALSRARTLAPALSARAAQAETERSVPGRTIEDLRRSGLFGVNGPAARGGSALGFAAQMLTAAELGAACGSTAWVYGVFSGHNWMLGLFP